jgi:hypothetical protein
MKTMLTLLVAALALALTGCSTINSRIHEHAGEFYALDPATQDQIRHGQVGIGYTPDMVYMALGSPTKTVNRVTNDGNEFTWIYKSYYEEYAGTAFAGYHRYAVVDRVTGRYVIYTEPLYTDLYRERAQEYIRLTFRNGRVTSVEQTSNA